MKSNQQGWNRRALAHLDSSYYDLDTFRAGKSSLRSLERAALGDVSGKDLAARQARWRSCGTSGAAPGSRGTPPATRSGTRAPRRPRPAPERASRGGGIAQQVRPGLGRLTVPTRTTSVSRGARNRAHGDLHRPRRASPVPDLEHRNMAGLRARAAPAPRRSRPGGVDRRPGSAPPCSSCCPPAGAASPSGAGRPGTPWPGITRNGPTSPSPRSQQARAAAT
jgi:hypothetical protein